MDILQRLEAKLDAQTLVIQSQGVLITTMLKCLAAHQNGKIPDLNEVVIDEKSLSKALERYWRV